MRTDPLTDSAVNSPNAALVLAELLAELLRGGLPPAPDSPRMEQLHAALCALIDDDDDNDNALRELGFRSAVIVAEHVRAGLKAERAVQLARLFGMAGDTPRQQ